MIKRIVGNIKDWYGIHFRAERVSGMSNAEMNVLIFLAADYGNLGDVAITYAQATFLKSVFPEANIIEVPANKTLSCIKYIKKNINRGDLVTIIGGGNMGDRYGYYERLRRMIIKVFRKNLVVSFPQTIDFSDTRYGQRQLKKTVRAIKRRHNLIVCARERRSYEEMVGLFGEDKVILVPDIVLFLRGKIKTRSKKTKKVGICLREDGEKARSDSGEVIKGRVLEDGIRFDTYIGDDAFVYDKRKDTLLTLFERVSSFDRIYTDRLHAMIIAYDVGTRCYFIDNVNKKISSTYETWLSSSKNVKPLYSDMVYNSNNCLDIDEYFLKFENEIKRRANDQ